MGHFDLCFYWTILPSVFMPGMVFGLFSNEYIFVVSGHGRVYIYSVVS